MTKSQRRALNSSNFYISYDSYIRVGLKNHLLRNHFSEVDAQFAVDHCGVDCDK